MKSILLSAALGLAFLTGAGVAGPSVAGIGQAAAAGCIKGAVVGGVAGHYAGHHALLGAAAGCAVGHHMATVNREHEAEAAANANANNPNGPGYNPAYNANR